MQKKIAGVIPPLATPFKDDELDLATFTANLERYTKTGLSGYLLLGSNGEAAYMDFDEKEALLGAGREVIPADKIMMVGAGGESTKETIALCKLAEKHGADCVLVLPPNYYKGLMNSERQLLHFEKVAQACELPVLYYNMPANTGLNANPDLVYQLSRIPNLVGIKDSSGNMAQLSEIARRCEDFTIMVGASPMMYPGLCLGAHGGILAVANVFPELALQVYDHFQAGDMAKALAMHRNLFPLAVAVTSGHGVPALKYAMSLAGFGGGEVRSPLTPLSDPKAMDMVKAEVEKLQAL